MSLMAFPVAPNDGDVSGKWVYDAASGAWVLNEGAITLANSSTDDLAEGVGNLYYSDARADARVNAAILDEDNMASDDAAKAPSQQSVKAYVDTSLATGGVITTAGIDASALVTEADTIASNDNDTTLPTSAAVKDLVDTTLTSGGVITTAGIAAATLVTEADDIGSNDNDTTIATSAAIVDYVAGANAATATTAANLNRQVIAGNGLTGGGTLTADQTLTIGAGTGITVNASDIRVNADQRGNVTLIGPDTNDYIQVGATNMSFVLDGAVDAKLFNNGEFHADGDVVAFSTSISDQRFKDQVTPITAATETCKKLQGVEYTWNATGRKGKRDLGFIAQEIEKVIPNIVHTKTLAVGEWADSPMDAKTVDYEKLTAVLVEAVKELSARIDDLESN